MSLVERFKDNSRLRGPIVSWGMEETEKGALDVYFDVLVQQVAPPDTYGDDDFAELEGDPVKVRVSRYVTETGDNAWTFSDLGKIAGKEDFDLDLFNPEEEGAYKLEGKAVTLIARHRDFKGKPTIGFSFLWPRKQGKPSRFAEQLKVWQQERKQVESAF